MEINNFFSADCIVNGGVVCGHCRGPLKKTNLHMYWIYCRICKKVWCSDKCAIDAKRLLKPLDGDPDDEIGEQVITCLKCHKGK